MDNKRCSKCKQVKSVDEFRQDNRNKSGLKSQCKQCEREYTIEYRKSNPEKIKESKAKYRSSEKGILKDKEWVKNNPDKVKAKKRRYNDNHQEEIKVAKQGYRDSHKEEMSEYNKVYLIENKKNINAQRSVYRKENSEEFYRKAYLREKEKINNDLGFKLRNQIRKNLYKWIVRGGYKKTTSSELVLGITYNGFIEKTKSQFKKGMTWFNYGEVWDFDHIIPICYAMTEDEVIHLNHYTNLQPMLSNENRYKKRNNVFYNLEDLRICLDAWI